MLPLGRALVFGAAAIAFFGISSRLAAQEVTDVTDDAAVDSEVVVLPPIVVTIPSPVTPAPARRHSSGSGSVAAAASSSGEGTQRTESAPPSVLPSFAPESFSSVTVIGEGEIERSEATNFGDVMFTKPGITSTTFAPGASRPIIRGLDNFRVRIQENGIGIHDVSALGNDHAVPIDPMSADRIEVIRGPATLRWGSQAIGGVVEASNNRIPTDIADGERHLSVQGAYTTVDEGWNGVMKYDNRSGNVAVHVDALGRNAEDYETPLGTEENSFVKTDSQAAGATLFFDRGFFGTSVSRFASDYGIPGGEEAELGIHIDMEQYRWSNHGVYRPLTGPVEEVRFWLGYSDYHHDEIGAEHEHEHEDEDHDEEAHEDEDHEDHDHEHELAEGHEEVIHGTFKRKAWEARTEFQHVPVATQFGELTGALGLQWSHDDLATEGEAEELLAPNTTVQVASYLFEELALSDRLRFQAAGRIENDDVDGFAPDVPANLLPPPDEIPVTAANRNFTPVSGSIGLLRDLPNNVVMRATAQYVERAPTASELFSKGSHHASGTFEIGDPDLDIEAAQSFEVGLGRSTGRFRFDASGYYTEFDGFIYQALTGITCDEEFSTCGIANGEFDQVQTSQRDATFYGAELEGQYDVTPIAGGTFGIDGQYDFVHATFADGSYVPRIPPHRLGGGLYWQDEHWQGRVSLLHAFSQDEVAAHESDTPGYNLLNASLSWSDNFWTGAYQNQVTIGLAADNLLDDEIRNAASFKADEVLLPGRSFRLFAKATF
ncbi:TonB-dependent receptor [Methyloligella sp. 2.7D]|nr:TonB-dependent receptor [Methyloligella sp. GL2]